MEKLSGILPKSSRSVNVDLAKSQPVRPGAPAFGRSVGKVTKSQESSIPELENTQIENLELNTGSNSSSDFLDSVEISNNLNRSSSNKNSFDQTYNRSGQLRQDI